MYKYRVTIGDDFMYLLANDEDEVWEIINDYFVDYLKDNELTLEDVKVVNTTDGRYLRWKDKK